MEIENLKGLNMIEIQKIDELKQDIEKSKSLRDYLKKDINDLEERLKNAENDNKQAQMEFDLKKNELEDHLNKIKQEIKNEKTLNKHEKDKYQEVNQSNVG
jgi:outer membrane murein-binding lipoprotein Lpp